MVVRLVGPSILERQQNHTLQPGPYHVSAEAEALHARCWSPTCTPTRCYGDAICWRPVAPVTSICRDWSRQRRHSGVHRVLHHSAGHQHRAQRRHKRSGALYRCSARLAAQDARKSERGRAVPGCPLAEVRRRVERSDGAAAYSRRRSEFPEAAAGRSRTWWPHFSAPRARSRWKGTSKILMRSSTRAFA